ncbi:MAG TPA: biopolymer transporter Tol, partial [Bacteroidota bacterium]|nr:biopolymer transporter Tol [Bacteroidota bacterium]
KTSLGNEASYNAGFAFVRYIAQKYGDDKLAEISRNLSKITAMTIDGAIEKAIGKSGGVLYEEWKEFLRKDYDARTFSLKDNIVTGTIVADVGFANFYPTFSPDGSKLAYVSNKQADYFALSSIYVYDFKSKTEKLLQSGVRSNLTWSIDGKKIYYAKHSRDNAHWSNLMDLYVYDLGEEKETRITHSLRANAPSVSPDGKTLVFIAGSDGTLNLFTLSIDDSNVRQLTRFTNGEQVYNPKWSPDGKNIVFDYSIKDGRDIALFSVESGDVEFILASPHDERNAIFTQDGSKIIYSSDKTGIFNVYQYDFITKESSQLTNVLGGAFMPSMNGDHQLAFSSYTSDGYKIAIIDNPQPLSNPSVYVKQEETSFVSAERLSSDNGATTQQKDWQALRSYDDSQYPQYEDTPYKNTTTSLTLVPFIRVDNYNPKNKGIDVVKLGLYGFSYDVLDHYGFFAGAAINKTGERDLFFIFDYRGQVPGLSHIGLEPNLSLEVYNITRKTDSYISLPLDTIPVNISYNLIQFDVAMKQKFLSEASEVELRYSHSRYDASIGSFILPESNALIPAFSSLYLVGNDISATWRYEKNGQSRTQEINPIGRKIRLRYDYEFHKFNPTSDYEISNGLLVPKYQKPTFHRLELSWREQSKLPGWKHTLSAHLRSGSILGPPVDSFFDFYIGGLAGMKGYPFYSLGGNEYLFTNLTYRFPVWENIDLRFLHLYFDKLYGAIYGDVGTAWTDGGVRGQKFKRDAGVELRLETFSFYSYPTRIFFNATYGFDQFTRPVRDTQLLVTYGKEWSYHFGVLFGFEFD